MFTLQDFFDDLAASEVANVKLGNNSLGTIEEQHIPKVISCFNQALVKVYQRLNLRQGTLKLHQHADVTKYYVRPKHAGEVDEMDDEIYLEQTDELKFEDDWIKLLSAVDAAGDEVKVNDRKYPADLFTSAYDVIDKAAPSTTIINTDNNYRGAVDIFTLAYQAKYPKIIVTESLKPKNYELYIPDFALEPLLLFTTYKLFRKPVKIAKGEVNPSTTLLIEYENAMRELEKADLDIDVNDTNTKLEDNGWA